MRAAILPDVCALPLLAMPESAFPAAEDGLSVLTAAIRAGDEAAFEQFHTRYAPALYRYALMLTRGDEYEAAEVAQSAWVKVATRCEICNDHRALWAWLRCVARNTFIDQCRARRTRERLLVPMSDAAAQAIAVEVDTALHDGLRQILHTLSNEERELLHAAYLDKQPLKAIAVAAGTTYKAVESKLGRLRARVRNRLLKMLPP